MQPLDQQTYLKLTAGAEVLERDAHGEKVLRLSDGSFFKLFRLKRILSSSLLYPYAQRFADNAQRLNTLGVPSPEILGVYRIKDLQRDLVHYSPLPGATIRQLYQSGQAAAQDTLRADLGRFVASLHDLGIYFRSLHLGNIVLTPEQRIGLIDIADLHSQRSALGMGKRWRNFKHLLRYDTDRAWLLGNGERTFFDSYLATTRLRTSHALDLALRSL